MTSSLKFDAMAEWVRWDRLYSEWYTTSIEFTFTFVVNVEPVILTPARDIVAVSRQANKILLVHMACKEKNIQTYLLKTGQCTLFHLWRIEHSDSDSRSRAWAGSQWRQRQYPRCWGTWRRTRPFGDPWTRSGAAWWTWAGNRSRHHYGIMEDRLLCLTWGHSSEHSDPLTRRRGGNTRQGWIWHSKHLPWPDIHNTVKMHTDYSLRITSRLATECDMFVDQSFTLKQWIEEILSKS